jgi:Ca2+-transporting ATPase
MKRNVLVRKLPASETLGRITVICTDKTGTLTQSEMKVVDIYSDGALNSHQPNNLLLKVAVLCNKASYAYDADGKKKIFGDPTDIGLLECGESRGIERAVLDVDHHLVTEFPFDSDRKRMSIIFDTNGKNISYIKGAPERILELISYEQIGTEKNIITPERLQELNDILHQLASE